MEFVREYSDSEYTARALYDMEFANTIWGENVEKRLVQYRKTVAETTDSIEASLAQLQIGLAFNEWYATSGLHAEDAIREFRKVVVNYPHSPYADDALYILSSIYFALRQDDKALIEYKKLRRLYPNSPLIPQSYAITVGIYTEDNDLTNAEREAEEFKKRHPDGKCMREVMIALENCRKRIK